MGGGRKREGGGFIVSYITAPRCMKVWSTWTLTRLSWLPSSMVSGGFFDQADWLHSVPN